MSYLYSHTISILLITTMVCAVCSPTQYTYELARQDGGPEEIRLAFGADPPTQVMVTWTTFNATSSTVVEYGRSERALNHSQKGSLTLFVDGGEEYRKEYIHRTLLSRLKPDSTYYYRCGGPEAWSRVFHFRTIKTGTEWRPRVAIFGDMGYHNAESLPHLRKEVMAGDFHAMCHIGDFAYNMDDDNGRVGDEFLRQMEQVAAYVPYMITPGNHDSIYNFTHVRNRFTMPNTNDNMMYSWNLGPIHFISISTEFYYFIQYGFWQIVRQYQWLERDLKEANRPENRAKRPWIVTMGHRPMYCTNTDEDDCTSVRDKVRIGLFGRFYGLEDLFFRHGVDLELWAHEHIYERSWPLYNRQVFNGSLSQPYTNPGAPVHLVTGASGCSEKHDKFGPAAVWTAFRNRDYSYTRMTVHNRTHAYVDLYSVDQEQAQTHEHVIMAEMWPVVIAFRNASATCLRVFMLCVGRLPTATIALNRAAMSPHCVVHGSDIWYTLGLPLTPDHGLPATFRNLDQQLSTYMMTLWWQFAKFGLDTKMIMNISGQNDHGVEPNVETLYPSQFGRQEELLDIVVPVASVGLKTGLFLVMLLWPSAIFNSPSNSSGERRASIS
ncbi:PREDICTED: iron/zinc purple acid phosphatase-like protein [Priapulus caudatus]|uniref:Purple acid phosphatase n=1 Tax=Priapulus caudatus TaxID=37621 RepID=A0ABM1EBS3_PRICU|nr:PREDICTED: iron/zinc purple acid phosphatase-like protein [Priapulus caudatus]